MPAPHKATYILEGALADQVDVEIQYVKGAITLTFTADTNDAALMVARGLGDLFERLEAEVQAEM